MTPTYNGLSTVYLLYRNGSIITVPDVKEMELTDSATGDSGELFLTIAENPHIGITERTRRIPLRNLSCARMFSEVTGESIAIYQEPEAHDDDDDMEDSVRPEWRAG